MAKRIKKIKLLLITQKVDINDDILGFMHGWIEKLAERLKSLDVICLYKGKYDLPKNVKVFSLGKEENGNKSKYLWRLYKYAWKLLKKNDLLFVHMNQQYVALLWFLLKIFDKPVVLFKASRRANQRFLKLATFFASKVISYSRESFPFKIRKLISVPPAVDTNRFRVLDDIKRNPNETLFVGRISPVKNLEKVVDLAKRLRRQGGNFNFKIIGGTNRKNEKYLFSIKNLIKREGVEDVFEFLGTVPNKKLPQHYNQASFFVDFSKIYGINKTILEAMACGCIPITNQTTIKPLLGRYADDIFVRSVNGARDKILALYHNQEKRKRLSKDLSQLIQKNHNLDKLSDNLIHIFALLA